MPLCCATRFLTCRMHLQQVNDLMPTTQQVSIPCNLPHKLSSHNSSLESKCSETVFVSGCVEAFLLTSLCARLPRSRLEPFPRSSNFPQDEMQAHRSTEKQRCGQECHASKVHACSEYAVALYPAVLMTLWRNSNLRQVR